MKFEKIYNEIQRAKKLYEENQEAAKALYQKATEGLKGLSDTECRIWWAYEAARDCGNEFIDLHDNIGDENVEDLVACMRECGFEAFTFSSGWSSAVETAWLFQEEGCTLAGLIEINGQHKDYRSGEYDKVHGYLFRL